MERNKLLLAEMSSKRREEEEELKEIQDKMARRRARFKENLLAKAMERRNSAQAEAVDFAPEHKEPDESIKYKAIAIVRRKFETQHRQLLDNLASKQKDKQDVSIPHKLKRTSQISEELTADDFGRGSRWGMVNWATEGAVDDEGICFECDSPTPQIIPLSVNTEMDVVAGSAIKAIRSRKNGAIARGNDDLNEAVEVDVDAEGLNRQLQMQRKEKEKVIKYLQQLSASKKEQEDRVKEQERRVKRRVQLLSEKVLMEATERKLMAIEDKHVGGVIPDMPINSSVDKVPKSLRITPEQSNAIYARLVGKQTKSQAHTESLAKSSVSVRDFAEWKRKHGISTDTKVFSISGWYPCVKEALIERGWHWNKDFTSPYYDLKWTNKTMDIEQESLQPWCL
jgi:hypothetical protein